MKETTINFTSKPKIKSPIVIEGLPGIGLVGKIAADHLLSIKKAKKFCDIYSPHFPPQVITDEDGYVRLVKNEFYHFREKNQDYIIIAGDFQGMTPESQYEITDKLIEVLKSYTPKIIYTLGGLGIGKVVKKPKVFGATNNKRLIPALKKQGIVFEGREGGGIFGASGLLLGLGELEGMDAVCLMGETVGQVVDAKSAKVLLDKLSKIVNITVDMKDLDKQAKNTEKELKKIQKLQEEQTQALQMAMMNQQSSDEDVSRYIR
jgi:hypothetical protein